MLCAHCSTPVADEARFCHSCGSMVSDAEGQAAATAAMDRSAFQHMEELLREETRGEYIVENVLGRGGMAVVYLATEVQLSRKVALKVLPPELTFGHGVERFKREAKTAAALDHPNIIPIYRIASSGKLFWYAMKYLEGRSLEDLLRERGSLSLDETLEILEQVADALDYAHERKVIHRDIKPANVMLDGRNRVIVTDFGIAKALTAGKLTATDSVIGTPYFMSPEQGTGKPVTGASDQYSVAVMAYRMLAGHVPFDGDSAIDILHKHCMFEPPSLREAAPHLPAHVEAAIDRALAKKADERFALVHDLVESMRDPAYQPRERSRTSAATVLVDSAEVRRQQEEAAAGGDARSTSGARSGERSGDRAGKRSGERSGARSASVPQTVVREGSDTPSSAETVVAGPRSGARPARPQPAGRRAPGRGSRKGLVVALALVGVLGAAGVGYWQLQAPASGTEPGGTDPAAAIGAPVPGAPTGAAAGNQAPTVTPEGPAVDAGAGPAVTQPQAPTGAPAGAGAAPASTRNATTGGPARPPPSGGAAPSRPAGGGTTGGTTGGAASESRPAIPPARQATEPPATPPAERAGATPVDAAATMGTLRVRLPVPGDVEIDGRPMGPRGNFIEQLVAGTHSIRVSKEGYETITRTVDIKAGETITLTIELRPRP